MTPDHAQVSQQSSGSGGVSMAEVIDRLSHFDGPPQEFLMSLLAVQCRLAAAEAGAILRTGPEGKVEMLAAYPQLPSEATAPVWLAHAVEAAPKVLAARATEIRPLHDDGSMYGQEAKRHLIMLPILGGGNIRGLAVFFVETGDQTVLAHCKQRLELSSSLLSLYEMRLTLQRKQFDLQRLQTAMETLAAINERDRFKATAMALCNEISSRWQCDRVSIGFLKGRYVHLTALSHTEKFNRKMKLVQDIEAAMEECLDQDMEILYPADEEANYVSRSTGDLSRLHGPMTIVSLPLRREKKVVGVLTVERQADKPFTLEEIEILRLTTDLCTARLTDLHTGDKWFGARAAASLRNVLSNALGPKHTWLKIAAIGLFAFLAFTLFVKGDYRVSGSFVLEAQSQQIVPAPFDGYIAEVLAKPGDIVTAGTTVLARLETMRLETELEKSLAEQAAAAKEADKALNERKYAEFQIASANARKAGAQAKLLSQRIREASISSPIDGTVVSPDISRRIRGHVKIGEAMFEVAPIESLRAEISVEEEQIADVIIAYEAALKAGQELRGELATEGRPDDRIAFAVERINPVAEVDEKENVFKVRVRMDKVRGGMRPGMGGVAKINVGKRTYAYMWTRKLVNWVRMKLWI